MASAKKDKQTVVIYQTWYEGAALFGEEELTKAMMQIIKYGLFGEVPDNSDDLPLAALMMTWCEQVDAQKKKRKGGAPPGNTNAVGNKGGTGRPKKTQPKNTTLKDKGNGNGNSNDHYNSQPPSADAPMEGGMASEADDDDW